MNCAGKAGEGSISRVSETHFSIAYWPILTRPRIEGLEGRERLKCKSLHAEIIQNSPYDYSEIEYLEGCRCFVANVPLG